MGRHRAPRPAARRAATLAAAVAGIAAVAGTPAYAGDAHHDSPARCVATAPAVVAIPVCVDASRAAHLEPVTTAPVTVPDLADVTSVIGDLL